MSDSLDAFLDEKPKDDIDSFLDTQADEIDSFLDAPQAEAKTPGLADKILTSVKEGAKLIPGIGGLLVQPEETGDALKKGVLEPLAAPFEAAGELVKKLGRGGDFIPPTSIQRLQGKETPQVPTDIFTESVTGLQGIAAGAVEKVTGGSLADSVEAANKEVERPKTEVSDAIASTLMSVAVADMGLTKLAGTFAKVANPVAQRVAKMVTRSMAEGDRIESLIQAEKAAHAAKAVPVVQQPLAEPFKIQGVAPKVNEAKTAWLKARKLESTLEETQKELDLIIDKGPMGFDLTPQEQRLTQRIVDAKAKHRELLEQIGLEDFAESTKAKNAEILTKIDDVAARRKALQEQIEAPDVPFTPDPKIEQQRAALAQQRLDFENELKSRGGIGGGKVQEKIAKLQAVEEKLAAREEQLRVAYETKQVQAKTKLREKMTNLDLEQKTLSDQMKTVRERNIEQLKTQAEQLNERVNVLEAGFKMQRMAKYGKRMDELKAAQAAAQKELEALGFKSQDVQERFVNLVKGDVEKLHLPETVTQARLAADPKKFPGLKLADEKNVTVGRSLVEGLSQMDDISHIAQATDQPLYVLDKLDEVSGGAARREIKIPLMDATRKHHELMLQMKQRLDGIQKAHGLADEDSKALKLFIEGKAAAPAGREAAFEAAKADLRKFTDDMLDLRNTQRARHNEPLINHREDYIPNMLEQNVADDLGMSAEEARTAMRLKTNDVNVGYDQRRLDLLEESEQMGAFEAVDAYINKTARAVAMSDEVIKLRSLARVATEQKKPNLAKMFTSMADRLTNDSTRTSNLAIEAASGGFIKRALWEPFKDMTGRYAANVIFTLNGAVNQSLGQILYSTYRSPVAAGEAVISGVKSQLVEQILKAAIQPKYRDAAMQFKVVRNLASKPEGEFRLLEITKDKEALRDFLATDKQVDGFFSKVMKSAFNFMNDAMIRGTLNTEYKLLRQQGYTHKEALAAADEIGARVHAIYADVFKPRVASTESPIGFIISPIQTYTFNAFNALKNDVAFAKLPAAAKAAAIGNTYATTVLFNFGIAALTGRESGSAVDFIPFYRALQFGLSGAIQPLRDAAAGNVKGMAESALLLGPTRFGGLQTLRTIKGAHGIVTGESTDPRDLLFGPKPRNQQ